MNYRRRKLLKALPAAGAALMLPVPSTERRVAPNHARAARFVPAAALTEAERERHEHYMAKAIELVANDSVPSAR